MSESLVGLKCGEQVYRQGSDRPYQMCGKPATAFAGDKPRCSRHMPKPAGPVEIWWCVGFSKYNATKPEPARVVASSPGYVTLEGSRRRTARKSDFAEFFPTWTDAVNRLMDLTRKWADEAKAELLKAEGRMAALAQLAKAGPPEVKADG